MPGFIVQLPFLEKITGKKPRENYNKISKISLKAFQDNLR